jgi:hypothetical protein
VKRAALADGPKNTLRVGSSVTHSDAENEQGDRMMRCEKVAQNVGRRLFSKLKKKKKLLL